MPEIFCQGIARDLCDSACHFHAGGSAANDYKSDRGLARRFISDFLSVLECHEQASSELDCVLQTF